MRVKATIDFTLSNNTRLSKENLEWPEQINTQNLNDADIFRNTFTGFSLFQFSKLRIEKVSTLNGIFKLLPSKGYNGFISKELSLSDKTFDAPLELPFNVLGNIPSYLFITFDAILNEYATDFIITNNQNAKTISINNNTLNTLLIDLTSLGLSESDTLKLTLIIDKWSKSYASAKVTRISVNPTSLYTEHSLISFNCSENAFDSQMNITPGICEQYADIKVYDRNGLIHKLVEKEQLTQNYDVTLFAIDNNSVEYILGKYITNKWDIDSNTSEVSVKCIDISKNFDKVKIPNTEIATRTLDDMLTLLFGFANVAWDYSNVETELYCKEFKTVNSWFREDNLYNLLQNICKGGLLRIYWYVNRFIIARCY